MRKDHARRPIRDEVTSVNADGSRFAIHPADVSGRFTTWRRWVAYVLAFVYAALPWIPVNGYPAVFLDTQAMRFHFFGLTFVSQDLWLAFFLITGLGFGLFYVTALFGRIWCGWACPQTVFLEHVYRRVERWIEGSSIARRKLDEQSWNGEKLFKRAFKHSAFIALSLLIAHLFMAYFVSLPGLWNMMRSEPSANWSVFLFVFVFAAVLYFNFTWFREQLCIVICPYGRLQSALIDDHSLVIGYDERRGEPRGKANQADAGDCIDCSRCVQVCPTGIDIRQGLQMECIGCSACIDACDTVMDRLKRPRGLVRYDSQEGFMGRATHMLRPRIVLYTGLLLLGITVLGFSLRGLGNASLSVWRVAGEPYYLDEEYVRNQYMAKVTNKLNEGAFYSISVADAYPEAVIKGVEDPFFIEGNGEAIKPVVALMPVSLYTGRFSMEVDVIDAEGKIVVRRAVQFVGPSPELLESRDG